GAGRDRRRRQAATGSPGRPDPSRRRRSRHEAMAVVTTVSAPRGHWPRMQGALGMLVLALVALVTLAPVLVVIFGAIEADVWRETFIESAANRGALGYSFLLALRAPVAALIGFLIAWLLIRIELPGGRLIEFAMWVTFFIPLLPVTLSWIL